MDFIIDSGVLKKFELDPGVTEMTIPDNVIAFNHDVFLYHTELTAINVGGDNTAFSSDNGVLLNKEKTEVILCPKGKTEYIIPDSVTSIGEMAFANCTVLKNIIIPDSVTVICNDAFSYCTELTSITIPDSVTSIGINAFGNCTSLTSITIPDSVNSIEYGAFLGCTNLTSINVNSANTAYTSKDGILFNKDETALIGFPAGKVGEYSIPNSVTSIIDAAFWGCTGLTSVTLPDSVVSIGKSAFYLCSELASINIPDSVTSIGRRAFEDTAWYDDQPDGMIYAGKVAYKYKGTMPKHTSIVIKKGTTEISGSAFFECDGLISITIPDGVVSIGSKAFFCCDELMSIEIPDSVVSIDEGAFLVA